MEIHVDGALEIEAALKGLGDQTIMRRLVRKALREAAEPMVATAKALTRIDQGDLRQSIKVGAGRKGPGEDQDTVGISVGIDRDVQPSRQIIRKTASGSSAAYRDPGVAGVGPMQEFGTPQAPAKPFMRPAWDAHKNSLISRFSASFWPNYESEAARLAKKSG